jgi:hypothetical protein
VSVDQNVEVVLEAFSAIERRDDQRFLDLLHPDRAPAEILSNVVYGAAAHPC